MKKGEAKVNARLAAREEAKIQQANKSKGQQTEAVIKENHRHDSRCPRSELPPLENQADDVMGKHAGRKPPWAPEARG